MPHKNGRILVKNYCLVTTLLCWCALFYSIHAVRQFSPRLLPPLKSRIIFNEQQPDNTGRIFINGNEPPVFISNSTAVPINYNCPAQVLQMPDEEIKINACSIQNQPFAHIGVSTSALAAQQQSPLALRLTLATQYNINADVTALFHFDPSSNYLYYVGQNMRAGKMAHIRLFLEGDMTGTPCVYANKLDVQFRCFPEEDQAEVQQEQLKNYFGTAADGAAAAPTAQTTTNVDEMNVENHSFEMPSSSSADLHPIIVNGVQSVTNTPATESKNPPARHVWISSAAADKKNFSSQSLFQPISMQSVLLPEQTVNTATEKPVSTTTKTTAKAYHHFDDDMHTTTTTPKPADNSNGHTWTLADVAKRSYMKKYEALESRDSNDKDAEIDWTSPSAMNLMAEAFSFGFENFGRPGRRSFR